jgi:hypothetical protein
MISPRETDKTRNIVRKKPYISRSFRRSLNRENVQAYSNGIPAVLLCSVHFTTLSISPDDSTPTEQCTRTYFVIIINLFHCSCNCICIVFIVCSVSFIVCVDLCAVFCLSVVCYFV